MAALRKTTMAAAVMAATTAVITLLPAPAAAATVRVNYRCGTVGMVVPATYDVTISAPATAVRGQAVTVRATVADIKPQSGSSPANMSPTVHTINLGGAASGTLRVDMNNPAIAPGTPWRWVGSAQITFGTAGTVTFQPGNFASREIYRSCVPVDQASVPVAARTRVS